MDSTSVLIAQRADHTSAWGSTRPTFKNSAGRPIHIRPTPPWPPCRAVSPRQHRSERTVGISPSMSPTNDDHGRQERDARGHVLWQMIDQLGIPFHHERSFRLCEGLILPQRFLLTLNRDRTGPNFERMLQTLWRRIGMPERFASMGARFWRLLRLFTSALKRTRRHVCTRFIWKWTCDRIARVGRSRSPCMSRSNGTRSIPRAPRSRATSGILASAPRT